jgi:glycosyltransferase involved in cell wall biosynthesis
MSPRNMFINVVNPVVIYPDIDLELYGPQYEKEDYVIWVSRMHPDKGIVQAIEACAKAHVKLKVSGDIVTNPIHREYYEKTVKPLLTKYDVEYVPTPDRKSLINFMRRGRALIFPIQYIEAFGYVVLESLALGTPVLATCLGAPSEIIEHGKSGFIVPNSVDAFSEALQRIDELKPEDARRRAEYFKKGKGAREFYELYKKMLDGKWPIYYLPQKPSSFI